MPATARRLSKTTAAFILGFATLFAAVDFAEARKAGFSGFGSRGVKTFSKPAPTKTAPNTPAPIQRTMTPQQKNQAATGTQAANQQRSGLFGGFGGALLGGLMLGGLFGMLFGGGLGGFAGFLGLLAQVAVIGFLISLAMRYFGSKQKPAGAAAGAGSESGNAFTANHFDAGASSKAAETAAPAFGSRPSTTNAREAQPNVEVTPLAIEPQDFDRFEEILTELQAAYSAEDYAALRKITTPEAMSFLAEELGELASSGKRNSVSDVKLLQGDLSEAWSEGTDDYATVAMRYEACDATLDRTSASVISGSTDTPKESTELWTFKRQTGQTWLVAAIQGTE